MSTAKSFVIGVDANEANVKTRVGTGQYTFQILKQWSERPRHDLRLYLRANPLPDMPSPSKHLSYSVFGPSRAWTRFALPFRLALDSTRKDRPGVFWSPAHYLPPYTGCPSIVTVHDLAYEYFPDLFLKADLYKLKKWTRTACSRATHVIAVSESTKQDLVKLYKIPEKKITVIYNGYDASRFSVTPKASSKPLSLFGLERENYLLFMGTIQPRKNVIRLVQAFHLLREAGYRGKLVLAGNIGWMAQESLDAIRNSPDAKQIVMTGYVSDEVRHALYAHAEVYVLPSLYEGFGVPVLEAMASGAPVAAANNSSIPEVVGKAGILFNAADPADIARAVTEVRQHRSLWVKRGLERAKEFSWDKCARQTLAVLLKYSHGLSNQG